MKFSVQIKASAAKSLASVPAGDRARVISAIDRLREEPRAGSVLKGEFTGLRRIRVGDYRIVYEVATTALVILVLRIAHRREAYR